VTVAVTGAAGFVGTALVARMAAEAIPARAIVRRASAAVPPGVERVVCDMSPAADWGPVVAGASAIVHLAARVHVMSDGALDPLAEFRRANVTTTLELARRAAAAGVKRFVFVSSVKVNGEAGVFTERDAPAPRDPYGVSKNEAEIGLRHIAATTGMEVVIIRPPLVYGPGVRANFAALARAVRRGIPLPLGAVRNRRSLIGIDNLVDVILVSLRHPAAANQTFLVSDGEDLSTPELIRRLAAAMGRRARLIPVPAPALEAIARLLGKQDVAARLLSSLQVDITKVRHLLAWQPPVPVDEGLRRLVASD
jgi:nucleoside-diphosphate-sugar epimerase